MLCLHRCFTRHAHSSETLGRGEVLFVSHLFHCRKGCLKDAFILCWQQRNFLFPNLSMPSCQAGILLGQASSSRLLQDSGTCSACHTEQKHRAAPGRPGRRERSGWFLEELVWAQLQQEGWRWLPPRSTEIRELQKEVGAVGLDPLRHRRALNLGNLLSGWDFKAGTAPALPLTRPEVWFCPHPSHRASWWLFLRAVHGADPWGGSVPELQVPSHPLLQTPGFSSSPQALSVCLRTLLIKGNGHSLNQQGFLKIKYLKGCQSLKTDKYWQGWWIERNKSAPHSISNPAWLRAEEPEEICHRLQGTFLGAAILGGIPAHRVNCIQSYGGRRKATLRLQAGCWEHLWGHWIAQADYSLCQYALLNAKLRQLISISSVYISHSLFKWYNCKKTTKCLGQENVLLTTEELSFGYITFLFSNLFWKSLARG